MQIEQTEVAVELNDAEIDAVAGGAETHSGTNTGVMG